jgi:hypothetical protein
MELFSHAAASDVKLHPILTPQLHPNLTPPFAQNIYNNLDRFLLKLDLF